MSDDTCLLWFRDDLRLADHPALCAAAASGLPILGLYVFDTVAAGPHTMGAAQRWWLHHSLTDLQARITALGGVLIIASGDPRKIVPAIASEISASAVFWNRRYMPWQVATDAEIKSRLRTDGRQVESFAAALMREPWEVAGKTGEPYRVFTPFFKALSATAPFPLPMPAPTRLIAPAKYPAGQPLEALNLRPQKPDWAAGFGAVFTPGEAGATARFTRFLDDGAKAYKDERNRPDLDNTSRLSPHLHFGEISIRTAWHGMQAALDEGRVPLAHGQHFLSELGWREFSYQLLFHQPHMVDAPLNPRFAAFEWADNPDALTAWQQGRTGYPIVDAGMRQLWREGWMHNRVRMIAGSFLIKDLLIDWRAGMRWFWDTLLDADPANNTASWQWVAGCGADAAPYFRIFNPVLQSLKFDPAGDYIRKYVPELALLPTAYIHAPWEAPREALTAAGIRLGREYPLPLVDHAIAREAALARWQAVKDAQV